MATRTTITLDDQLHARLKQLTGPRGMSRFINETLAEKIQRVEHEKIEALMKAGYLATKSDRAELNADWGAVDIEEWPK